MILSSLCSYYDRLLKDGIDIPQAGFSNEKISFCVLFDEEGNYVDIIDIRDNSKGKPYPAILKVPAPPKRTRQILPCVLWDKADYSLGITPVKKLKDVTEQHNAFIKTNLEFCNDIEEKAIQAFCRFLNNWTPTCISTTKYTEELKTSPNIVFRLDGDFRYIHEYAQVRDKLVTTTDGDAALKGFCLVTGNNDVPIQRLHPPIKGIGKKDVSLVSFNKESFKSYGKDQSFNSPVSKPAAFAYGTVLNYLLSKVSRQKCSFGETTFIFWSERKSEMEDTFTQIFGGLSETASKEMVDGDNSKIKLFLDSARLGKSLPEEFGEEFLKFYILGLSPNNTRVYVRFWMVNTMGELHKKIGQHISDC